ncbi:hypothetical protein PFISCL1PPCAC_13519, partial [Pristionchus fissidentatus]
SLQFNSGVAMVTSISGALTSSFCYILVFVTLRKRSYSRYASNEYKAKKSEFSIFVTSLVLFCALCAQAAYFVCNSIFVGVDWDVFYKFRAHSYIFSFFISLANPWCLMLTSKSLRSAVLHRCLPSCCTRNAVCAALCP